MQSLSVALQIECIRYNYQPDSMIAAEHIPTISVCIVRMWDVSYRGDFDVRLPSFQSMLAAQGPSAMHHTLGPRRIRLAGGHCQRHPLPPMRHRRVDSRR